MMSCSCSGEKECFARLLLMYNEMAIAIKQLAKGLRDGEMKWNLRQLASILLK